MFAVKLPISHPDYRYSGSANPYWKKVQTYGASVMTDNQTEQFRGRWREQFVGVVGAAVLPLVVEIGCNAGHVIVEEAKRCPDRLFIGIDWKFKAIARAADKSQKLGLKNLILLRAHAERLRYMFGEGEITKLNLFFPDPWAKKSQLKNRFFTSDRLKEIAPLMSESGEFEARTDHPGYFEWMRAAVDASEREWTKIDETHDRHKDNPQAHLLKPPDVTLFESLFVKDGLPIHLIRLLRRPLS
jgi:tRNA (guanine-N(7)-)-methyltransferase